MIKRVSLLPSLSIEGSSFPGRLEYGEQDALSSSAARNDADDSSDIEIVIDFEPEAESFDNLMNVADLLDIQFGSPVDPVTVERLSPYRNRMTSIFTTSMMRLISSNHSSSSQTEPRSTMILLNPGSSFEEQRDQISWRFNRARCPT